MLKEDTGLHLKDARNRVFLSSVNLDAQDSLAGTIFYKQIVAFGEWVNPLFPVETMTLDAEWAAKVVDNFNKKLVDHVPIPLNHTNDVEANTGEVIKLEIQPDGLYAYLDIRRPETVADIRNGLIFDVSIYFDWDFVDTKTGDTHGPVLEHVALVNNPYLTGMKPFTAQEAVPAFAKTNSASVIMFSKSKVKELSRMKKATAKNEKDFDVEIKFSDEEGNEQTVKVEAGKDIEVPENQLDAVKQQFDSAEAPDDGSDSDDEGDEGSDGSDGEGADNNDDGGEEGGDDTSARLSRAEAELAQMRAEKKYSTLLNKGKITPAQKDKFLALANVKDGIRLSKDKTVNAVDLMSDILEAGPKVVEFDQKGSGKDSKQKPQLSKEEKEEMKARFTADPDKYAEFAEKYGLTSDDEEE